MTMRNTRPILGVTIVLATALSSGCPMEDGNTGGGILVGQVSGVDGQPVAGAAVVLDNGRSASADHNGFYSFSDLEGGSTVIAGISADGFAPTTKSLTTSGGWSTTPACVIMAPAGETVEFDESSDSTQRIGNSAITIEPGSLVDADGAPVTGMVDLTATYIDPSTESVLALPGSFDNATTKAGETVTMESFGFAFYQVIQDGKKLDLAPGSTAVIEYLLPENALDRFSVGETIPLWELDGQSAVWGESGSGLLGDASDGSGRLAWFAEVPHLGYWNCGIPLEDETCITGRVLFEGSPLSGAGVTAVGISYNGTATDTTRTDGVFSVDVKRGSTVRLEIRLNGAASPVSTQEVTVPDVAANGSSGGCLSIEDISVSLESCLMGRVSDRNGAPEAGVTVHVAPGETTTTDVDGYYCAASVADQTAYVFAEGRLSNSVTTPPSGSCPESCAEADITITLPEAGDVVGRLFATRMTTVTESEDFGSSTLGGQFLVSAIDDFDVFSSLDPAGLFLLFANDSETEQIGDCTVTTIAISESATFDEDEFDLDRFLSGMDPGSPGSASYGSSSVELLPGDPVSGLFAPTGDVSELDFGTAMTIAFAFPGGIDLGAFDLSLELPDEVEVTSPDLSDPELMLDTGSEFSLTWNARATSDEVIVIISGISVEVTLNPDESITESGSLVLLSCAFPDTGSATIPAEAMSRLPMDGVTTISIARRHTAAVEVPLHRVAGLGVVEGTATTRVSYFLLDFDDFGEPIVESIEFPGSEAFSDIGDLPEDSAVLLRGIE